jgi:hypothetical protein
MRWVRHKGRVGAWLALAALALQIVVSFGHVHLDGARHSATVGAIARAPGSPAVPDQQPAGDPDDYCAICATIYLAANAFVPLAPQLAVPFVSRPVEHVDHVTNALILQRRAPFQSRAPPAA